MHLTASSQPEREEQEYRGEGMPSPAAPKKNSKIQRFWRENREGWMFVFPLVIGLGLFTAYPMIQSLVWSFFNYTGATYYFPVGLNNFIFIFSRDIHFWRVLGNTCYYAFVSVPIVLVSGYLLACLANLPYRSVGAFRVVFYLPCVIPGVVSGMLWDDMFANNGVFNEIFALFGAHSEFFDSANSFVAISSIFLMNLWSIGGGMILWLSAFKSIPSQLYEAAKIDGAGIFARFLHVTIPGSAPMIFFNVVTMLIGTFQYNGTLMLYPPEGTGYQDALNMFGVYIYAEAFRRTKWGYASALSWVLMVLVGIVTAALFGIRRLIAGKEE